MAVNTVEYVTADGDADSDNDRDLADLAALQNCYSADKLTPNLHPACRIFDLTIDNAIDEADFAAVSPLLTGP